jgi:hypothetical protein
MTLIRALVCSVVLVVALAPTMAAFAAQNDVDHLQAELANAAAQYQLALDQAAAAQQQGQLSQQNERMIAFLQSEAMRQKQLDVAANGNAIEAVAATLANALRAQGDLNARNELIILQNKAAILVSRADATMANALAQGRADEIANAKAQSLLLHNLADTITSVLAETNMSNARIIAQNEADVVHSPGLDEQANGRALAAGALFAADGALQAGRLAAYSAAVGSGGKQSNIVGHAAASLRNAQAMAAAAGG